MTRVLNALPPALPCFPSAAAPPNPNREVAGDTIIFRDTQISSRAVYQCNTSNEHGYLLANAFVSVLGECTLLLLACGEPPWVLLTSRTQLLFQSSARLVRAAGGGEAQRP